MKQMLRLAVALAALGSILNVSAFAQQVTRADYERALGLRERYSHLAIDIPEIPHWIGDSHQFWYRKTVPGGNAFMLVDADAATKKPAFDRDKLAAALSVASGEHYTGVSLPFQAIRFSDDRQAVEFPLKDSRWK